MPTSIDVQIGLPSGRSLSNWIKEGQHLEVKLLTNDILEGKLRWQDADCICLLDAAENSTIIWRHAIAYIRPVR